MYKRQSEKLLKGISNLKETFQVCDLVAFYDNTEEFRRFAILKKGKVVRLSHTLPEWIKDKGII